MYGAHLYNFQGLAYNNLSHFAREPTHLIQSVPNSERVHRNCTKGDVIKLTRKKVIFKKSGNLVMLILNGLI